MTDLTKTNVIQTLEYLFIAAATGKQELSAKDMKEFITNLGTCRAVIDAYKLQMEAEQEEADPEEELSVALQEVEESNHSER